MRQSSARLVRWWGAVALCLPGSGLGCRPAPRPDGQISLPLATPTPRPPATSHPSPARRDILRTEKKIYSQHDEEIIVRDFFQDRREGVFLDVGCARPKKESNTFYLEDQLGWSGIGVDALAEFAQPWKKRRRSRFFHFAVTDRSGDTIPFHRARGGLEGISSITPRETFSNKRVEYDVVLVPTITLTRLLDDNGVSRLDFLSMDIEGAEPLALAGFDIERFRPQLACVETRAQTRAAIRAYFARHGYEQIARYVPFDVVNDYFTPRARSR